MQEAKMNFKGDEIPVWTPLGFIKQTALTNEAVTRQRGKTGHPNPKSPGRLGHDELEVWDKRDHLH